MVQDTTLDRSSARHATLSGSAKALASHAKQLGLSDPWRFNFPSTKVYSFFSHPHHTYSRIDFFLMDDRLLSKVKSCEYHSIVISDLYGGELAQKLCPIKAVAFQFPNAV